MSSYPVIEDGVIVVYDEGLSSVAYSKDEALDAIADYEERLLNKIVSVDAKKDVTETIAILKKGVALAEKAGY
ncbi:MAG: hypothetical protein JKY49_00395 [Cohaesibacteraceae bacterium]|nr:hypothetical protein [Cohaesibacteraceae bacterium]MBL4875757.1 hypothetical protein [Cohaesibacteraceae bacterium]